jgi:Rrf2 family protein
MPASSLRIDRGLNYAFHALLLMAKDGRAVSAGEVARALGVPMAYMAKLLQYLAHAGLVAGQRGRRGGYALALPPDEITLWDVALALRGGWGRSGDELVLPSCSTCPLASACPLKSMLERARLSVERVFKQVSIGAMARQLQGAKGGK